MSRRSVRWWLLHPRREASRWWLWVREGRPRDRALVIHAGSVWIEPDGNILVRDWHFDSSYVRPDAVMPLVACRLDWVTGRSDPDTLTVCGMTLDQLRARYGPDTVVDAR